MKNSNSIALLLGITKKTSRCFLAATAANFCGMGTDLARVNVEITEADAFMAEVEAKKQTLT